MIKILQVVTHMNRGGLETMLMNYYRHMDRNRIQFDFLTHRPYDGDYGAEIEQMGGKIFHLPVLNPLSIRYRRLLKDFFMLHHEYTVIHVHQDCMSSIILKTAEECGVKVRIAHSHNANQDHNWKYLLKIYYRRSISKYATELFACGKEAGDWMFCGAPYTIIHNAIDTEEYKYNEEQRAVKRRELGISQNQIVIGHVGRFSPAKNHSFLIDIFEQIHIAQPQSRLLLVGNTSGEVGEQVLRKINECGLQNAVIIAGVRSDVNSYLQAMDCFVFPSIYEGLPVTLIEAQAAGLPCFISDRVPIECKKTALVRQIPLAQGAELWSQDILKYSHIQRRNTEEAIAAAGYDIKRNAIWLQNFYEEQIIKGDQHADNHCFHTGI